MSNQPRPPLSQQQFQLRFLGLIFIANAIPPAFGSFFLSFFQLVDPQQAAAAMSTVSFRVYGIGQLLFNLIYFYYLFSRPIGRIITQNTPSAVATAERMIRRFPFDFWIIFAISRLIAPTVFLYSAQSVTGIAANAEAWVRIHLLALSVSIIIGVPIFFLLVDLFGRLAHRLSSPQPLLRITTKIFLIAALTPLMIDTLLILFFSARTGFFTGETIAIWALLELLAICGALLFVTSFKQSLTPLNYILKLVQQPSAEFSTVSLQPQSTDELGAVATAYRTLLLREHEKTEQLNHSRQLLEREKQQALITLEGIQEGVVKVDELGMVEYANPAAIRLAHHGITDIIGLPFERAYPLTDGDSGLPLDHIVASHLLRDYTAPFHCSGLLRLNEGEELTIQISVGITFDPQMDANGCVYIIHDITESLELNSRLDFQAAHDALTGLVNRHEFELQLEEKVKDARLEHNHHALLYLDLDQFKVVNETCGHQAGDTLLQEITAVIRKVIRDSDTLARLGGDEFGILFHQCPLAKAATIADHLRQLIKAFRFHWGEKIFEVTVSMGLAPITSHSASTQMLMSAVDSACDLAKELGRNRIYTYSEEDETIRRKQDEMDWVHRLTTALDQDLFILYAQEIRALDPNRSDLHYEILIRLRGEDGAIIPPNDFLPAAERFNMMPKIDRWVVRNALQLLEEITSSKLPPPLSCSINLSGQSLGDGRFLGFVTQQLERFQVPPEALCFEITETAAITNLKLAEHFFRELQRIGIKFSLDDFGSGLSSFGYLKNLPISCLKIDGSFVRNINADKVDHAMVESINQIGHVMGLSTIAEYAENSAVISTLKRIGIDYAQGYGITRPVPLEEVLAHFEKRPSASESR
ncbi:MAG: EAL domain-containing protein [Gammaproteobacteria bacterium]|nr:EAL domain-containing protein [Gammaproteobacteria bacterium]